MLQLTQDYVNNYASTVLDGEEPERLRKLLAMMELAVAERAPGLPIMVGHVLGARGERRLAEYAFMLATGLPEARGNALFELGQRASADGRLEEAAVWLRRLDAEQPLDDHQLRVLAHVLGRSGDMQGALACLDRALPLNPAALDECLAVRQFCEYIARFPAREALRRTDALTDFYPLKSSAEIADDVLQALGEGRPYSLIRLNDGEGSVISLSLEDEARYQALYRRNRRDFHVGYWFGNTEHMTDPGFLNAMGQFNRSIASADAIGAHHLHSVEGEYSWGSIRNVSSIFNVVRKLEALQAELPAGQVNLCHPQVHHEFLRDGHLERLLRTRTELGLVSCHAALPGALQARFGFREVHFHRTPGEASLRGGAPAEPFASWHGRLCAELAGARPGVLYLVSAGVQAKIYCDIIKRAGGVALDMGAVADIWMAAPTRGRDHGMTGFALAGADAPR